MRTLATQEARPLESALQMTGIPFWSADSRYLLYSDSNKLRRVDATGGPAQLLGAVQTMAVGGFATSNDKIVFADIGGGIMEVPSSGGTPTRLKFDAQSVESGTVTPSLMPGNNFVFCQCGATGPAGIYIVARGTGAARKILPDLSIVQYAPSPDPDLGYILFLRGGNGPGNTGTLMAQAIQPRQLRLLGDPVAVAEQVRELLGVEYRCARL